MVNLFTLLKTNALINTQLKQPYTFTDMRMSVLEAWILPRKISTRRINF